MVVPNSAFFGVDNFPRCVDNFLQIVDIFFNNSSIIPKIYVNTHTHTHTHTHTNILYI